MDYTLSDQFFTHTGTGQRMHKEDQAVTTAMTADDFNSIIWSLMEIVKAAGLAGVQFDPDVPASYGVLLQAVRNIYQQTNSDIPGRVAIFMQPTPPIGWFDPVGQPLSRTVYSNLFNHVQTVGAVSDADWFGGMQGWFSSGDGSTTFRAPDFRAVSFRGLDAGRGIDIARLLGSLQQPQLLAHAHAATIDAVADHLHAVSVAAVGDHNHAITVDNGGNHHHDYTQPVASSTGAGGGNVYGPQSGTQPFTTADAGVHNHTASSSGAGNHAHAASSNGAGAHAHTASILSAGGVDMRVLNVAVKFFMKY